MDNKGNDKKWCDSTVCVACPACEPAEPASATITSPADDATLTNTSVPLLWNDISDWGNTCNGADSIYEVYVGACPDPSTLVATLTNTEDSYTFTGTLNTTYCWKVRANNGQEYTDSEVRSFTILNDTVTGTVYMDTDGTCDTSNGGTLPGLGVQWGDDTATVNSNGTYTIVTSEAVTQQLYLTGIPAGYICSTACGPCSVSSISPGVNGTGNNFFLTRSREAWWQAMF